MIKPRPANLRSNTIFTLSWMHSSLCLAYANCFGVNLTNGMCETRCTALIRFIIRERTSNLPKHCFGESDVRQQITRIECMLIFR